MFYGLDRLSVDLDFDLLDDTKADAVFERAARIAEIHGTIKESFKKRFSLFLMLSYEDRVRNIKIEINKRHFGSRYEIKTYLGVSMQVMVIEDMFAHKLVAMYERAGKTNRDVYDVWFFLNSRYPLNRHIVESRTQLPFDQFIGECIARLTALDNRHILDGMGELLTTGQKDWAKASLRDETIALLTLRKETA